MAIIKDQSLAAGYVIPQAYMRIQDINGSKNHLEFTLYYFVSQQATLDGKPPIFVSRHEFIPTVEEGSYNFIKQGYEHLKTLPEFADAIDA